MAVGYRPNSPGVALGQSRSRRAREGERPGPAAGDAAGDRARRGAGVPRKGTRIGALTAALSLTRRVSPTSSASSGSESRTTNVGDVTQPSATKPRWPIWRASNPGADHTIWGSTLSKKRGALSDATQESLDPRVQGHSGSDEETSGEAATSTGLPSWSRVLRRREARRSRAPA